MLDINYFNAQRTPTLTKTIAQHSIYQHFKKNGLKIAVVKRMLRVESANELDKAQLALGDNNCVGNMISIAFNDEGRQVEYTDPVYAIQRVRIVDGIRAVLDINYFNAQRTPTLTKTIFFEVLIN
ncbi:hypothetical protein WP50_12400 [Lactiplantibacillus plantarum]|nr:hypothetical protein WP50_12400 [Lactiplantibacillus plantarum]